MTTSNYIGTYSNMITVMAIIQMPDNRTTFPVYQGFVGYLGLIKTYCPSMGWQDYGITDDFGNVVESNWSALPASLAE